MKKINSPITITLLELLRTPRTTQEVVELAKEIEILKGIEIPKLKHRVYDLSTNGFLTRDGDKYKLTTLAQQSLKATTETLPANSNSPPRKTEQLDLNFDASAKQKAMLLAVRDAMEEQHNYRKALIEIRAVIDKYLDKDE